MGVTPRCSRPSDFEHPVERLRARRELENDKPALFVGSVAPLWQVPSECRNFRAFRCIRTTSRCVSSRTAQHRADVDPSQGHPSTQHVPGNPPYLRSMKSASSRASPLFMTSRQTFVGVAKSLNWHDANSRKSELVSLRCRKR